MTAQPPPTQLRTTVRWLTTVAICPASARPLLLPNFMTPTALLPPDPLQASPSDHQETPMDLLTPDFLVIAH